jgi:hypothetical protein
MGKPLGMDVLRVTTMHSSKGLDALVVFLFFPCLPFVCVILAEKAKHPAIKDLPGCFAG